MRYFFVFIMFFPTISISETSLWKISNKGNELYLGGTIHVLKKEDYPLPPEYTRAFKKADKLVLEANVELAKTPEYSKKMTSMLSYPPGKSLKNTIKKETYYALKKYLADRNIPIESFEQYTPQMIVLIVTVMELKKIGMVDIGVDEYFYQKAKKKGKSREYFETIDEQLEFIRTMGQGSEDAMLLSTMRDMQRMQSMINTLKTAWLNGDEDKLVSIGLTDMMRDYPETYQSLLVNRNNKWIPRIEKMLRDKQVEIILVGALHLVGEDGLLQQLRNKGYKVKKFR